MRLVVLSPSYAGSGSPMAPLDPPCSPAWVAPEHDWRFVEVQKATAVRTVRAALADRPDAVINLCDGAWDEDRAGLDVAVELTRSGVPFTGAGPSFFEPTRDEMKLAASAAGIATPAGRTVDAGADLAEVLDAVPGPWIVKHPNSYSSIGLTPASVVSEPSALAAQIERMVAEFGAALVETFVDGREFTVLVAEDGQAIHTWPAAEFHFPPGHRFKHFDLKWVEHAAMSTSTVDPTLDARLRAETAAFFEAIGGSSYARCDIRMGADGVPVFLEINPYPGVFYPPSDPGSADAILHQQPGGHRAFLDVILRGAFARAERDRPRVAVRRSAHGHGLVATRPLAAGELVWRGEGAPVHLVSRTHVEATWGPKGRADFAAYAWPITDELFATWAPHPSGWRPIDHSCDPNTWLVGLDLVARRPLSTGTPLTMDYATFCGPTLAPFRCGCGSPRCRGIVDGTAHLRPDLDPALAGHFSDWVARARGAAGLWR